MEATLGVFVYFRRQIDHETDAGRRLRKGHSLVLVSGGEYGTRLGLVFQMFHVGVVGA